ncbi:MAG TPA: adenosylmethionine--8-amino-7-oxononanoate transaminase [Thermodesulfovibrionales bacterium]|nr:adenosylmethionine--8-amino-7-oxononanoate transaminase [Thermodesulfovibrionales bacterium]
MDMIDKNRSLEGLDKRYIWHPFTQMKDWLDERPVIISEGKDCFLKDIYGNWYLDGVSSLWVNMHGHRKRELDDAIRTQLAKIAHSTMLGLSNEPAITLAERLIGLLHTAASPHNDSSSIAPPLSKVFYSDNGSTAVEVALKMAFQYWLHKGMSGRTAFLSLENAYHGDTLGAVSVGGIDIFHKAFGPLLFQTYRAPSPYCYRCTFDESHPDCTFRCLGAMEDILKKHSEEIAAVIVEPLVQAAGGMIVSPPGYLRGVRELSTRYRVLMIADEVATGFGRTGRMFACEHEAVIPDILCLSKGLTGGYLPLAATVATDEIYNAFLGEFRDLKTFFHGHSYTGNPLGCAAALACLDIFHNEDTLGQLRPKIERMESFLKDIAFLDHVGNVRSRGLMAGIELVRDKATKEPYPWEERMGWRVAHYAKAKGIFIRPLGNIVVIMPPLSIVIENLERLMSVIAEGIRSVTA